MLQPSKHWLEQLSMVNKAGIELSQGLELTQSIELAGNGNKVGRVVVGNGACTGGRWSA